MIIIPATTLAREAEELTRWHVSQSSGFVVFVFCDTSGALNNPSDRSV